jgi:regulator of sirC expression with transglutaminase-like and TPR domain
VACIVLGLCASVHAQQPTRAWEFELKTPGTFGLQVEHTVRDVVPGAKVTYAISIGTETKTRELELIANRPFVPLIADIPSPRKMRVVVSGLAQAALQQTRVYAYNIDWVPYGEYFDPAKSSRDDIERVRNILARSPGEIDLARAKLTIDKMVSPAINIDKSLKQIDALAVRIRAMPEFGETATSRAMALQRYVYKAGAWNGHMRFEYDLDDPLGTNISNKLLPTYLASRKGNCVTMPLLFVILGQRLGLEMTASLVPNHILVKFRNEFGIWINLEATSGANPAREVWIRQQNPTITDEALANGVYLQPLTKKETVAVMATLLAEHFLRQQQYEKAIAVADLVLEYHPMDVAMMTMKAVSYGRLARRHFIQKYPLPSLIPVNQKGYFEYLSRNHDSWFAKAEALGWLEETKEQKGKYLKHIKRTRQQEIMN